MKIKSVKFNFIMNFILTASNFIFPLITFPYVSRVLGASGTGKVSFAISVVSYFTMVAALGIPTYGIRTTAKVRDDQEKLNKTTQEMLIIHLFMMLLVSIVYILAILFVPRFQSDQTLFLVVGVSILLKDFEEVTSKDIFDAAKAGDEFAKKRVDDLGQKLALAAGNIASMTKRSLR